MGPLRSTAAENCRQVRRLLRQNGLSESYWEQSDALNYFYHIYNLEILSVTKNCHGDEGCPRADCINGVISVVTMVCVMYDMYSDQ